MSSIDISVCAVPSDRKDEYLAYAKNFHAIVKELGPVAIVETWGDDVPEGKVTDFRKAVKAEANETIAVGWIVWKDKPARDAAWEKMMKDERMMNMKMPFDGKRMIYGTFATILES